MATVPAGGRRPGLVALGLAIGLFAALAAGRIAASQLFGVNAADPVILGVTTLALLAVGAAASAIPGLQAARVQPREALAEE